MNVAMRYHRIVLRQSKTSMIQCGFSCVEVHIHTLIFPLCIVSKQSTEIGALPKGYFL